MNQANIANELLHQSIATKPFSYLLPSFLAGLLLPFGFAPFHFPGLSILGIAFLYRLLQRQTLQQSFYSGFAFGLGFLGLGVSWVFVSIHEYGHLNLFISAFITLLFIVYLAIYPALVAASYTKLASKLSPIGSCFLFSALWCLGEYLRATFLSGFPWLLLGFGQTETPLKYLLPILGIYGVSFFVCLAATFLAMSIQAPRKRALWIIAFVILLLSPSFLKTIEWATLETTPQAVAVIQANLSMRDKWDEALFWHLLETYKQNIEHSIGKDKLIVLPESAIPVPLSYVTDYIEEINKKAKEISSSVLLGIPQPTSLEENYYYNTLTTLGMAEGTYQKQHLVPFGEFIPQPFQKLIEWLAVPAANMAPGKKNQSLIQVKHHPVATLICYELAYPQLLRQQMPQAKWIVSISDDGWFGHSFAMYQQLQMAQTLSIQMARYQVVANNDGLSSIVDNHGDVLSSLPAFSAGTLEGNIYPATGATPWVFLGDTPTLLLSFIILLFALTYKRNILLRFQNNWPFNRHK